MMIGRRQGVHAVLAADGELVVDQQAQADVLGEAAKELDDPLGVVDVQVDVEDRQVLLGYFFRSLMRFGTVTMQELQ